MLGSCFSRKNLTQFQWNTWRIKGTGGGGQAQDAAYCSSRIISSKFSFCTICYLRVEPRSREWIHCFNSPVPLACNTLRLMGALKAVSNSICATMCTYVGSKSRVSPQMAKLCKERIVLPVSCLVFIQFHTNFHHFMFTTYICEAGCDPIWSSSRTWKSLLKIIFLIILALDCYALWFIYLLHKEDEKQKLLIYLQVEGKNIQLYPNRVKGEGRVGGGGGSRKKQAAQAAV